jgi:hypothetical protein
LAKKLARKRSRLQIKIDAFMAKTPIALASFLPDDQYSISGDSHQHLDLDEEDDEAVEHGNDDESSEYDEEEDTDEIWMVKTT